MIKENEDEGRTIEEWLIANQPDVSEVLEVLESQEDNVDREGADSQVYSSEIMETENILGMIVFSEFQQQIDSDATHVLDLEDLELRFGITLSESTDTALSSCFVMHKNSELYEEWNSDAAIERLEGLLEIMIAFDEPMEEAFQYSLIDEVKIQEAFGDVNKAQINMIETMYTTGVIDEIRWEILPVFISSSTSAIYENTMYIYVGIVPVDDIEKGMIEWIITDEKMVNTLADIMVEQNLRITDEDQMLVKIWKMRQIH